MGDIGPVPKLMRPRPSPPPSNGRAQCRCPACPDSVLVDFTTPEEVCIELCQGCKGMQVMPAALEPLLGGTDLDSLTTAVADPGTLGPCSLCDSFHWRWRALAGAGAVAVGTCQGCGTHWLEAGALERLRSERMEARRRARRAAGKAGASSLMPRVQPTPRASETPPRSDMSRISESPTPTHTAHVVGIPPSLEIFMATATPEAGPRRPVEPGPELEPFDRVSFDRSAANATAVPLALVLALGFCSTSLGQFFGGLVGMPFHELGHALTSWLSSRFAMPLPFFTIWQEEQSRVFGAVVAMLLAGFALDAWHERRRFGVWVAAALLLLQVGLSTLVAARSTLMLQILGGCLGELVLAGLVLIAFHFPLPDRLRWDFWRWLAIVPASICFMHALLLWSRAASDASVMPWGSAIGDDSDGDMNRLVYVFGWRALELASLYRSVGWLSLLAIVAGCAWPWLRSRATAGDRAP
jgi:hypothetical protein